MDNRVTITIPTRNRPHHLQRLLRYYNSQGPFFPVLILDSSDEAQPFDIEAFSNLSVTVRRFDPEVLLPDKVIDGLQQVRTCYVQFNADDDFIDPDGISKCADFLDAQPEFSAAQGTCVHFSVYRTGKGQTPRFQARRREHQHDVDYDSEAQRLLWHLRNYRPTYYALHRTSQISCWYARAWSSAPHYLHMEVLPSAITAINGKVKRLYVPFEFREEHAGRLCNSIPSWNDLITSGEWDKFNNWLVSGIARELELANTPRQEAESLAEAGAQEWISTWHRNYFRPTGVAVEIFSQIEVVFRAIARSKSPARRSFFWRLVKSSPGWVIARIDPIVQRMALTGFKKMQKSAQERVMRSISSNYSKIYRS